MLPVHPVRPVPVGAKDISEGPESQENPESLESPEAITEALAEFLERMEPTRPDALRAVSAGLVLRRFGQLLRGSRRPGDLYECSHVVQKLDEFWSHSWQCSLTWKLCLLLFYKNGLAACVAGCLAAACAAALSYADVFPGWSKLPLNQTSTASYPHSPWTLLAGLLFALLALLLWHSRDQVFLDKVCIHQADSSLKMEALLNLGWYLKSSRRMVVVWDSTYLSRTWCLFELAAFLHSRREPEDAHSCLLIKPILLAPVTFAMIILPSMIIGLEICLPAGGLLQMVRIVALLAYTLIFNYLLLQYWRSVMAAEVSFQKFCWADTSCQCCSVNHFGENGEPIMCDREILTQCISKWFGSIDAFEARVRTEVRNRFIAHVSTFPCGYAWMLAINMLVIWGQTDFAVARARGRDFNWAAAQLVIGVAAVFWISPTSYLIAGWLARWQSRQASCMRLMVGYLGLVVNTLSPHAFLYALTTLLKKPLLAAFLYAGSSLLTSLLVAAAFQFVLCAARREPPQPLQSGHCFERAPEQNASPSKL